MPEKLIFTDQSALDLRLNVIEGEIDSRQLSIFSEASVKSDNIGIDAAIIGASHAISVYLPHVCLSEVFACIEIKTSKRIILSGCMENISNRPFYVDGSGFKYRFEARLESWRHHDINRFRQALHDAKREGGIGMVVDFPSAYEDSRIPQTMLMARIVDNMVSIGTLHSYPNENYVVFSQTIIMEDNS